SSTAAKSCLARPSSTTRATSTSSTSKANPHPGPLPQAGEGATEGPDEGKQGRYPMQRYAFKMFLNPGEAHEYRRRLEAIWPELKALLSESGVSNYSIFLDPDTNMLFAYLEHTDDHRIDDVTKHSVMQRWWAHMKDIMAANSDGSPVTTPPIEMFHLEEELAK